MERKALIIVVTIMNIVHFPKEGSVNNVENFLAFVHFSIQPKVSDYYQRLERMTILPTV